MNSWREIAATGIELWLDAGVACDQDARRIGDFCQANKIAYRLVVALETISNRSSLGLIVSAAGDSRVTFSLDLIHGKPLTSTNEFREVLPIEIADIAVDAGFRSLIVLDLAHVGSNDGVGVTSLIKKIRSRHPSVQLTSGGGVRSVDDIQTLIDAGCDKVMVASALHDGRIDADGDPSQCGTQSSVWFRALGEELEQKDESRSDHPPPRPPEESDNNNQQELKIVLTRMALPVVAQGFRASSAPVGAG